MFILIYHVFTTSILGEILRVFWLDILVICCSHISFRDIHFYYVFLPVAPIPPLSSALALGSRALVWEHCRWRGWEHCPRDPTLPSPFLCPGPLGVPPSTPLSWTYCPRGGRYIYWGISIMSFLLCPGPRGGVYCSISKLYVFIIYHVFTTSILARYYEYFG